MAGLLGMNSPYSPEMTQLLGLDPAEMRRQAIFRGLQQAGVQLMQSGQLGDAFQGLSQGVNEAKDDYMQQAMLGYKMNEAQQDREWEAKQRARQEGQWQAQDDLLAGVDDPWARAYPDQYAQHKMRAQFAGAGEQDGFYGSLIPLQDANGNFAGWGQAKKSGGIEPAQVGGGLAPMSPYDKAAQTSGGAMAGKAPEIVVKEYVEKIRPAMQQTQEALGAVTQARSLLEAGIETGSGAEIIQGLRGWGATIGVNVDESVLSNTQAYQNFIGNVVIPKMQQLGGNDSNEEMRKMYSLSGGDISQAAEALRLTIAYTEKLLANRLAQYKPYEDAAMPYLPQFAPLPDTSGLGGAPAASAPRRRKFNPATGVLE